MERRCIWFPDGRAGQILYPAIELPILRESAEDAFDIIISLPLLFDEIFMSYDGFYHICQAGDVACNIHESLFVPENQILAFGDDLSYGPLINIDADYPSRLEFLEEMFGGPLPPEIHQKLIKEAHQLQFDTPRTDKPIAIWHGENPAEQLLLRRAVYALRGQQRPLFEVPLGTDLLKPVRGLTAYGMLDAGRYSEAWENTEIIATNRARHLISDWQQMRKNNGIRHWKDNRLSTHPIDVHDDEILSFIGEDWVNHSVVAGTAMGRIHAVSVSDRFAIWRIRILIQEKRIEMRQNPEGGSFQIRRAQGQDN